MPPNRNYGTAESSRNNVIVALLSSGEGWHNNHHAFPPSRSDSGAGADLKSFRPLRHFGADADVTARFWVH